MTISFIHSDLSSFWYVTVQNWYFRNSFMIVMKRGIITSLCLSAIALLLLAAFATGAQHCPVNPVSVHPSQGQESIFDLAEFHKVSVNPFLQPTPSAWLGPTDRQPTHLLKLIIFFLFQAYRSFCGCRCLHYLFATNLDEQYREHFLKTKMIHRSAKVQQRSVVYRCVILVPKEHSLCSKVHQSFLSASFLNTRNHPQEMFHPGILRPKFLACSKNNAC